MRLESQRRLNSIALFFFLPPAATLQSLFHLARSLFAEGNTHGTTVSKFPFTIDVAKLCSIVVENDDVGLLQYVL